MDRPRRADGIMNSIQTGRSPEKRELPGNIGRCASLSLGRCPAFSLPVSLPGLKRMSGEARIAKDKWLIWGDFEF